MSTPNNSLSQQQWEMQEAAANAALQQAIQEATAPVAEPTKPTPITVPIGNRTVSFGSAEELGAAVEGLLQMQEEERQRLANEAAQAAARANQTPPPATPAQPETPASAIDETVTKLGKEQGVSKAVLAAFGAEVLGTTDPQAVVQTMKSLIQQQQQASLAITAQQFYATHPDVTPNSASAKRIGEIVQQTGLPINATGLEAAYAMYHLEQTRAQQASQQQPQQPVNPFMQSQAQPQPQHYVPNDMYSARPIPQQQAAPVNPAWQHNYAQRPATPVGVPMLPSAAVPLPTNPDWEHLARTLPDDKLNALIEQLQRANHQ